ncbi:hypothetical protein B4W74_12840 [Staphylococcus intermedius]|uniref:hypothetical protein n=1 Tax=Staphylococcus intermedius TaxID=1285 RepID=UPI000BBBAE76|nr:hypothetical protein [Staphylococcus intermedius]PCF77659.1 hypothetical protein B4W74_12840 [Staphylococcus intermedius]PCF77808.1 hypothetical protein B4W70_12405 [Staphylococcus intermedius]
MNLKIVAILNILLLISLISLYPTTQHMGSSSLYFIIPISLIILANGIYFVRKYKNKNIV